MPISIEAGKNVVRGRRLWGIVCGLIAIQILLTVLVVHRESLTFDEGNHMFAGYMMWHTGDYGLNPEHPPLVKLLAAVPTLGRDLWVPELKSRDFKAEAYLDGRDWVARNDGDRNQIVFQMRLAAGLLAVALLLVVFFAAREMFGDWAGLAALALVALDPNVLAHSALVTTDIGVSLFFLTSIWCFYRYVKQPGWQRLLVAGAAAGLLLAAKHSGIMLAPMLLLLIAYEVNAAEQGRRARTALRLAGAFCVIVVLGVLVLWSFYGFRYAARPAGLKMSTTLADYVEPFGPQIAGIVNSIGRMHLLPESYLIGLVDVGRMAAFYPTYIFGTNYSHGVWWYFPVVITIKTTLGLLALTVLAVFALATRKLKWGRGVVYLIVPALFYLGAAILSNMNIGARHLLPFYAFLFVLAGAGAAALAARSRRWAVACAVLVAAHAISSLAAFPNYIPYANEAWGGQANVHNLLSDANADWAQQLYQVKAWQDRHPGEECWFAYFAFPEIKPETYGIRCHHLPNMDTFWMGGADNGAPVIEGTVLLSAADLSGCEWPASSLSPYGAFRALKPDETIDHQVMVYRGRFDLHQAAALARAENALQLVWKGDAAGALPLAQEAVEIDPTVLMGHSALGDALEGLGRKDDARREWTTALIQAQQLDDHAQLMFVPDLEAKLKK
ncbi:MAG: glycosyltransferase family 39 protein [Terracidiphilus sp.]|nr:glycosyltransferase family 39 protein [Terracidiphilus sp.]